MGLILSNLASSAACCLGSTACNAVCKCCNSCKTSTLSRAIYAILLLLGSVAAWVLLSPWAADQLKNVPMFIKGLTSVDDTMVGTIGVYRICFGMSVFFTVMCLLTIQIKSTKDCRATLHDGWWGIKILLFFGVVIGCFFMPNEFYLGWSKVALGGAFVFILIQLVLLVEFAHSWSENWVSKYEESENQFWYIGLFASTILMYVMSLVFTILLFVFYTHGDGCGLNKAFIGINLALCIIVSALAISPRVQQVNPRSGLLQAAVVSLYSTYLVWSSISNEPNDSCGPQSTQAMQTTSTIVGALFTFIAVAYSSIRTGSRSDMAASFGMNSSSTQKPIERALLETSATQNAPEKLLLADEDEEDLEAQATGGTAPTYSYSYFHLVFVLATLYICMLLTDWASISGAPDATIMVGKGWPSVWVKMASSWIVMALYAWSLVAPLVLVDRDFGYSQVSQY